MYFFDCQSTTPIDKRIIKLINKINSNIIGNSSSSSHPFGWKAFEIIEEARSQIAKVIGAEGDEIIFTSGATESNNLAIKGMANFYKNKGNHIITMSTEHKCVLESCMFLEKNYNFQVTYLDPEPNGLIDMDKLKNAITDKTILISIMGVNNETGVLQDLKKIGELCKKNDILFHTDCAQAYGKIALNVNEMNIDMMSISSHKIYGPKGIGALFVRKKPRVRLSPIIHGGGQERGMRSGTLPTSLIAGFGLAAKIMQEEYADDVKRIKALEDKFLDAILKVEDCYLNGDRETKIVGCSNVSILHIEGESLMMAMPKIAVSTGSACNSASLEPSYVISAMRKDTYYAHSAMRFGFSKMTTEKEVDYLINTLLKAIEKMRKISPLWQMKKNGIDISKIEWDEDHH